MSLMTPDTLIVLGHPWLLNWDWLALQSGYAGIRLKLHLKCRGIIRLCRRLVGQRRLQLRRHDIREQWGGNSDEKDKPLGSFTK